MPSQIPPAYGPGSITDADTYAACCGKPGDCQSDCGYKIAHAEAQQFAASVAGVELSKDSAARKATPICTGVLDYFPLALAAVARVSFRGNEKHNPGEPLHWARGKSTDQSDALIRHQIERGGIDPETGELHEAAVAWRALAQLQIAEEKRLGISPKSNKVLI
jgi:hypothetical protein